MVRLDRGDEIVESLKNLSEKENLMAAEVTGIGALDRLVIGVFQTGKKLFVGNSFDETLEATAICGNISSMNGKVYIHLHLTAGRQDGTAVAGHLQEARISATGELIVTVIDGRVERAFDDETGLNLFKF